MSLTDRAEMKKENNPVKKEGFDAYWDGILYEQNPYLSSTMSYQNWADGWTDAEEMDNEHVERE